jgi:hypothetical protein
MARDAENPMARLLNWLLSKLWEARVSILTDLIDFGWAGVVFEFKRFIRLNSLQTIRFELKVQELNT